MRPFALYTATSIDCPPPARFVSREELNDPSRTLLAPCEFRKIAVGVRFDDDLCVLKYLRLVKQPHIFQSLEELETIVCSDGQSRLVWGMRQSVCRFDDCESDRAIGNL